MDAASPFRLDTRALYPEEEHSPLLATRRLPTRRVALLTTVAAGARHLEMAGMTPEEIA